MILSGRRQSETKNHHTVNVVVCATCNISLVTLSDCLAHIAAVYLNAAHVFFQSREGTAVHFKCT